MDYTMDIHDTINAIEHIPDIYNLNNFDAGNNNYYVFNITFHNKGINTLTLNGVDLTDRIEEPDYMVNFKDLLKGHKKYKELLKSNFIVYIRQQSLKPISMHRSNDSLHGLNDKSILIGVELSTFNIFIPSSTRITDYVKITLIPTLRYTTPDKINYFVNTVSQIHIFSRYSEIYAFEIKTKISSLHHTNFNKKIMLPIKYNCEIGEMECHVFSKIINKEIIYVFYITKLVLPHNNIIDYCTTTPCRYCIDYSQRFDICDESKYKLICSTRIMNIRMKIKKILAIKHLEITLDKNDLKMFIDKFENDYIVKTYMKPF